MKAQLCCCKLSLKVNLSKQISCSKCTDELWSLSPSWANLCDPAAAGSLPAQPAVPPGTGPHPFAPLLSTLSILLTQEKPLRDYAQSEQCSASGFRKPYVPFHVTLTKSQSFCFPFHPHRTFLLRPSSLEGMSDVCPPQPQSQWEHELCLFTLQAGRQAGAASHAAAVCSPAGQHSREENPKNIKLADVLLLMLQLRHSHCSTAKSCSQKYPAVPQGLHNINKWSGLAHLGVCHLRRQFLGELYQQEQSIRLNSATATTWDNAL